MKLNLPSYHLMLDLVYLFLLQRSSVAVSQYSCAEVSLEMEINTDMSTIGSFCLALLA